MHPTFPLHESYGHLAATENGKGVVAAPLGRILCITSDVQAKPYKFDKGSLARATCTDKHVETPGECHI